MLIVCVSIQGKESEASIRRDVCIMSDYLNKIRNRTGKRLFVQNTINKKENLYTNDVLATMIEKTKVVLLCKKLKKKWI
jgi:hypothetical protein